MSGGPYRCPEAATGTASPSRIEVVDARGRPSAGRGTGRAPSASRDTDADGRRRRVRQLHGHLGQRQPVALDQVQHLDVEGEAVDGACARTSEPGDVGAERLAARTACRGTGPSSTATVNMLNRRPPTSRSTPALDHDGRRRMCSRLPTTTSHPPPPPRSRQRAARAGRRGRRR